MTRMEAERLEQAQSGMRLENRAQAKEHSAPTPVTSDLMTVKEAAAYLRVSVWAYDGEGAPAGRLHIGEPVGRILAIPRAKLYRCRRNQ
jgi:hypothetical protein